MSGFAAIYNLDEKPVEAGLLAAMSDSLAHRGADDTGIWQKKSVGFVHRMRWTTPESLNEKLPAKSRRADIFITCDARIDNRAELLAKLPFEGIRAEEISDSEIILAAYEKWGEDCLPKLIGDFVFVIWDARREELFAARDALGIKSFYYCYKPSKFFALASEIKALFAHPYISQKLNEEQLGDYLMINFEDKENTFYQDINRLPATHSLKINRFGKTIRKYWQPDFSEIRLKNADEYQEAFKEKFDQAVACRLRSAYSVGASLSGGLDSSAVVCAASNHLSQNGQEPLHTYSAIFPSIREIDSRIDEMSFMESVIRQTNCRAHFVETDNASPLEDIDRMQWHAEHPVGASSAYLNWEIYKAVKAQNVRVLLTGGDGDSTVGHGYEDFAEFVRRGWYLRLIREAKALSKNMPRSSHTFKRLFLYAGLTKAAPPSLIKFWAKMRRRRLEDYVPSPIRFSLHSATLKPEFSRKMDLENRLLRADEENAAKNINPIERNWNRLTNGNYQLSHEISEKTAAAFGIELRHPFFDRRLIEFCIALPPGQRIYKGWTRSILRHAMRGVMPEEVRWRTAKANLGSGLKVNLLKYGFTRLENAIHCNSWKLADYIDVESLKAAYAEYQADPLHKESEMLLVMTNVYLLNWLEQNEFVSSEKHSPVRRQAALV